MLVFKKILCTCKVVDLDSQFYYEKKTSSALFECLKNVKSGFCNIF